MAEVKTRVVIDMLNSRAANSFYEDWDKLVQEATKLAERHNLDINLQARNPKEEK